MNSGTLVYSTGRLRITTQLVINDRGCTTRCRMRGLTTKCDINHKTSKDEQFRNDFEFVDTTCNKKTKIISSNHELPDLLPDSQTNRSKEFKNGGCTSPQR